MTDINFPMKGRKGMVDWARNSEDKVVIPKGLFVSQSPGTYWLYVTVLFSLLSNTSLSLRTLHSQSSHANFICLLPSRIKVAVSWTESAMDLLATVDECKNNISLEFYMLDCQLFWEVEIMAHTLKQRQFAGLRLFGRWVLHRLSTSLSLSDTASGHSNTVHSQAIWLIGVIRPIWNKSKMTKQGID